MIFPWFSYFPTLFPLKHHGVSPWFRPGHVKVSFEEPEYTAQADGVGTLRLLEAIRTVGLEKTTRFYQASTSELYGMVQEVPQKDALAEGQGWMMLDFAQRRVLVDVVN